MNKKEFQTNTWLISIQQKRKTLKRLLAANLFLLKSHSFIFCSHTFKTKQKRNLIKTFLSRKKIPIFIFPLLRKIDKATHLSINLLNHDFFPNGKSKAFFSENTILVFHRGENCILKLFPAERTAYTAYYMDVKKPA